MDTKEQADQLSYCVTTCQHMALMLPGQSVGWALLADPGPAPLLALVFCSLGFLASRREEKKLSEQLYISGGKKPLPCIKPHPSRYVYGQYVLSIFRQGTQ